MRKLGHELLYLKRNPRQKKFWTLADFDKRSQSYLKKVTEEINILHLDILTRDLDKRYKSQYDLIFVPGIIYLFNDDEVNSFFSNIGKMINEGGHLILCHRSLDTFWTRFIHHCLVPLDLRLSQIVHLLKKRKLERIEKTHHGYLRTYLEICKTAEIHGFEFQTIQKSCFGHDFTMRFKSLKKLKVTNFIKKLLSAQTPYLSILTFKKTKEAQRAT